MFNDKKAFAFVDWCRWGVALEYHWVKPCDWYIWVSIGPFHCGTMPR